jgi:outer membrane protein OmpA-like peptidoglycan-associated protein
LVMIGPGRGNGHCALLSRAARAAWLAAWLLGACMLQLMLPSIALAEPRESSWSAPAPGAATPPADASASAEPRRDRGSAERAAAHALEVARHDLASGRVEIARRLLEALIARYPDAPSSDEARRDLYALYRRDGQIAGHAPDSGAGASAVSVRTLSQQQLQAALRQEIGDRIFFSAGSAAIGVRSRTLLQAQAEWLARHPALMLRIEGHADDSRAGADNGTLSRQRAQTIRAALIAAGVEPGRLIAEGIGASDPVAECENGNFECAAQNRRVVLHVLTPSASTEGSRQQMGQWTR